MNACAMIQKATFVDSFSYPVWHTITGKRKGGGKNVLLYSYLKTFLILLKKLLKETFSLTLYGRKFLQLYGIQCSLAGLKANDNTSNLSLLRLSFLIFSN